MVNCEDEGGKQYNSKADLWLALKTTNEIKPAEVRKKIAKSMDNRLLVVVEKKGHYIRM